MNTAEYLIKKLEEIGVKDFFGVPGDYNFNIVYAVQENSETNWVGCTSELNAGYAADGYAREKNYGAVVTTYGVGELSVMNAIAGSYAENVPVINIVGAPSTKLLEEKVVIHHQFMNPKAYAFFDAYKQITETGAFLNRDNAKIEIDRVLRTFVKERRPVYLCIPEDIAVMGISDRDADYGWMSDKAVLETVIDKVLDKIKYAERPVILADALVRRFDAVNELKNFADKSGIPVVSFPMGMGIIDTGFKNYLGTYLSDYGNSGVKKALETSDCVISAGAIYSDFNSFGFKLPYKLESQTAVYGTHTYVDGKKYENIKMSDVLQGLANAVEGREYKFERTEYGYEELIPEGDLTSDYIYSRLQSFYKDGDVIIPEIGLIPYGVYRTKLPDNVSVHTQALWCSIGWATGAAFGACVAKPESRVVLITGDGAHQISAMEVGNMLRHGFKPVIVVINNGGYTIERALSGKFENALSDIVNVNYSKFARVFEGDIWSTRVETQDDFDKALRVTGIMNKLCYIEACVPQTDMPWLSRKLINGAGTVNEPVKKRERKQKKEKKSEKSDTIYTTKVHESLIIDEDEE